MSGLHFAFAGRDLLLERVGDDLRLPDATTLAGALGTDPADLRAVDVRLPSVDGALARAYDLPEGFEAPEGMALLGLRALHPLVPAEVFRVAGTAIQKLEWLRTHGFCSRCGTPTGPHPSEEARLCPACGHVQYPRLSPAVIVLIHRGDEMLLARSPGFPPGVYSTIAGFVEPGESLEDTVHREIREEVGVEVDAVRYFGSQPWPFPHSLMVGFTARWSAGEIRIDGREIEHAAWFAADRLPERMPTSFSIARRLVDHFLEGGTRSD